MSENLGAELRAMTADARLLFAVNEMKRQGLIGGDQATTLRKHLLDKNSHTKMLQNMAKNIFVYEDLKELVLAHLSREEPLEIKDEYSPQTSQKLKEVENDSSPVGEMLLYKKIENAKNVKECSKFQLHVHKNT